VGPFTRFVRRYLSWFVVDSLIALVAVAFAGGVWRIYAPLNMGWPKAVASALALALLFGITAALLGVNRIDWSKARPDDVYEIGAAWLLAGTTAFGIHLFAHVLPLGVVAVASILALCGFVAFRYRSRLVTGALSRIMRYRAKRSGNYERVLIIGSGQNAEYAAWVLHRPGNAGKYQLLGFVDNDLFSQGMRVYGADVLGACRDVPELVVKYSIDAIILADHSMTPEQQNVISDLCQTTNTRLVLMPNVHDSLDNLFWPALLASPASNESKATRDVRKRESLAERGLDGAAPLQQPDGVEVA
jgi:FlaA1/EpsC-like NDP-sugar epimerase